MPWVEDKYLSWFGESRTSYGVKDSMGKTKVTGNENVDNIQDGVSGLVGGQFGKGGLGEPISKGVDSTGLLGGQKK